MITATQRIVNIKLVVHCKDNAETLVISAQLVICLETSRAGRYTTTVTRQIIKQNSK